VGEEDFLLRAEVEEVRPVREVQADEGH